MKYYESYMNRQRISQEMHEKLLELGREGAQRPRAVRSVRRWRSMAALAACCALVLGLGMWTLTPFGQNSGQFAVGNGLISGAKDPNGPGKIPAGDFSGTISDDSSRNAADYHGFVVEGTGGEELMFPFIPSILYQDVTGAPEMDTAPVFPDGSFLVDLTKEDICTIFWGPEGKPQVDDPKSDPGDLPWMLGWGGYTVHGYAWYDGQGELLWLSIYGTLDGENASFTLALGPGGLPPALTCLAIPDAETTDVSGVSVTGWSQTYDRNGDGVTDYICGSEFMAGDVGVRFESVGAPFQADWDPLEAACRFNALLVRQALSDDGGLYLDHLLTEETIPEWRETEFSTLDQAREEAEFAPYLPQSAPAGYGDFYGHLSYQEGTENTLFVRWSRGYDDVGVYVYRDGCMPYHLADASNPASYDTRLYTIPWCDSVPEEYMENFRSTPTFRGEDMSLEIVKARCVEKDTGGTSCSFQVLHPDGTLVKYSCSGLSAEQVWEMVERTLTQ